MPGPVRVSSAQPEIGDRPRTLSPSDGIATLQNAVAGFWWQIAVGGAIAIILGMGVLQVLTTLAHPLALLILAISVASAMAPPVAWLERRMPRIAAILLVYLIALGAFAIIGQLTLPTLVNQAQKFGGQGPDLMTRFGQWLGAFGLDTEAIRSTLASQLGQFSSTIVSLPFLLFSSILEIFLVIVMSIYWLIVAVPARDLVLSLFPDAEHERVNTIFRSIGRSMGGYMRATIINGLIIGFLTYMGLSIIGVQFPLVLGVLAGLMELIPIVGPIISGLLVVAVALVQSPTQALIALAFMFMLQQLEGNFLVPNIMRSQTDTSPLLVILALLGGNTIGGLLGALIAIPVVSAFQVLILEIAVPKLRRRAQGQSAPEEIGPVKHPA